MIVSMKTISNRFPSDSYAYEEYQQMQDRPQREEKEGGRDRPVLGVVECGEVPSVVALVDAVGDLGLWVARVPVVVPCSAPDKTETEPSTAQSRGLVCASGRS